MRVTGSASHTERSHRRSRRGAPDVVALVSDELHGVEALFRKNLASPVRIIDEIGGFVAEGGGKRIRPTLHLLCCRACGYSGPHHVLMATVLEFIHTATLIHDDIIDGATTRRGRTSVNSRWGNNVTVLFGDYLYAKAMEMALETDSLAVMRTLARVTLRMVEGEMLQTRYEGHVDLTEEEHLALIERKTAALFGACCELAGILGGLDRERQEALGRFGINLGMAFQIVDDLLDFTGDARVLGKPSASDLREGKVTLALIDLLARGSARARELALEVMRSGRADTSAIVALKDLLRSSGAIGRARRRGQEYAERATRELDAFADGPALRGLRALPGLVLFRDR